MRNYFETFKAIWNDERGRALIKLGLYLVFILFVIMYARSLYDGPQEELKKKNVFESYLEQTSYSETITLEEDKYELTNNNGSITFTDDDNTYIVSDNLVIKPNSESVEFDIYFWNLTPSLIGRLVSGKEIYYETKYNDDSVDKAYKVSLLEFINYFGGSSLSINTIEEVPNEEIIIVVSETKEEVIKVKIDLSCYYRLVTNLDKTYNVQIEY